jgi:alpha-L-fucosidase
MPYAINIDAHRSYPGMTCPSAKYPHQSQKPKNNCMTKSITLFLALLVTAGFLNGKPFKGTGAIRTSQFIYKEKDVSFPSCHASTLTETANGLVAAWFGGAEEKAPDVCIYTSTCVKGKWKTPVMVADGIDNGKRFPCWNPVLFTRDNGDIVLYYKVGPDPRTWWGKFRISTDNGETWSAPSGIPEYLLGPIKNKPVRLPDGTIMYPTSFETPKAWNIYIETSDQQLKNWKKITIDNNGLHSIQPSILFHRDGKLQLLCRSKNKTINESWSKDNGRTWSPVTPTQLPNNNAGTDAVTLSDGRQLLIFNPVTKGRNKLAVAISQDGVNWEAVMQLENDPNPKGEYSYPAVIQTRDGLVHFTYTWRRELIKHVVIDLSKVKTKPILNGIWPEE